ncbi:MAG: exodeoxyribonuclease VII small subunit [Candidatus Cloacimonetes bacterium]|nr:exodeoxyribonuclease VII small subunit [Candidatus Cloacimonadota bacterium]
MNNDIQFKIALKRLEEIIEKLEDDIDDLDELVKLFEEGSELVAICDKKLSDVESKIEMITKKLNERSQTTDRGSDEE